MCSVFECLLESQAESYSHTTARIQKAFGLMVLKKYLLEKTGFFQKLNAVLALTILFSISSQHPPDLLTTVPR